MMNVMNSACRRVFLVTDIVCAVLVVCILVDLPFAWKMNMDERPTQEDEAGSAYNPNAIGSVQWVENHPSMSHWISRLSHRPPLLAHILAFYMGETRYYPIPAFLLLYFVGRCFVVRQRIQRIIYALLSLSLLCVMPFLADCVDILTDIGHR